MKLEEQGYAIDDASSFCLSRFATFSFQFLLARAIELDPKYVKAYYRLVCCFNFCLCELSLTLNSRALCHLAIVRPQKAVVDFKKVLQLEPQNKLAKTQLETTQKLIRKTEFEKVWFHLS